MKRDNIELVIGFLDAIRRRERETAGQSLSSEITWQGVLPDLVCRTPGEVLDVFLDQRDQDIEVDRLELLATENGALLAFHRPESWEIAGIQIEGVVYHTLVIENGRITTIEDHIDRDHALADLGLEG
jgi:hypothetical protein